MNLQIVAALLATMASVVVSAVDLKISAFGINCEGSFKCHGQPDNTAAMLVAYINDIDCGRFYGNGQHIACRNNICAFLQGEQQSISGEVIKNVARAIVDHGCTVCGSVPTSAGNNVAYGELTFNYVNSPSCEGRLC